MFFRRKKTDREPTQDDRAEAARVAVDRLARYAADDAARAALQDATRADALRRAHSHTRHERLAEPGNDEAGGRPELDAEIAAAVDRLGPEPRGGG